MEQSFLLKHYGHLSLAEQMDMTAEERDWWLKRIDQEHTREREAANRSSSSVDGKVPPTPGRPPA